MHNSFFLDPPFFFLLQFSGGCWYVLRDLGELQVGAVHYIRFTAALGRTDRITVTGIVQMAVLCAWTGEKIYTLMAPHMTSVTFPHRDERLQSRGVRSYACVPSAAACQHFVLLWPKRRLPYFNLRRPTEHPAALLPFIGDMNGWVTLERGDGSSGVKRERIWTASLEQTTQGTEEEGRKMRDAQEVTGGFEGKRRKEWHELKERKRKDEREVKGEGQTRRKTPVLTEQEWGSMGNVGRFPAPPLSMNSCYVPKSVLPVTSLLLNNEKALGAT